MELIPYLRTMSVIELILCPDPVFRIHKFQDEWRPGKKRAYMDNGGGDSWQLVFYHDSWSILYGLNHESDLAAISNLPAHLKEVLPTELSMFPDDIGDWWHYVSFCYWYDPRSGQWNDGVATAGFGEHLSRDTSDLVLLNGDRLEFCNFVEELYECEISRESVDLVFEHVPLTQQLVSELNAATLLTSIEREVRLIGYPNKSW